MNAGGAWRRELLDIRHKRLVVKNVDNDSDSHTAAFSFYPTKARQVSTGGNNPDQYGNISDTYLVAINQRILLVRKQAVTIKNSRVSTLQIFD
jgi:2-keto-3-deoxy-L-rhamnonate aldolase RhmA